MQSPTSSDPAFLKFLEDLKKQNTVSNLTQLGQLKYEKEMAKEDNDKREEQLDHVIDGLKEIRIAVTGVKLDIDIAPLVDSISNQTEILRKSLEEQSLLRKVSEGSLEYDKASAQYRNTSGREIISNVSGKEIKKGGYVDFETATDRLSGQSKRVRDNPENKLNINTVSYSPAKTTIPSKITTTSIPKIKEKKFDKEPKPVETFGNMFDLFKEIKNRFSDTTNYITNKQVDNTSTNNITNKQVDNTSTSNITNEQVANKQVANKQVDNTSTNYKQIDNTSTSNITNKQVANKQVANKQVDNTSTNYKQIDASSKVNSTTNNLESDNVQSPIEVIADSQKQELESTKQTLDIQQQQLLELKKISAVLAPSTPAETPTTTSAVTGRPSEEGSTVDGALPSLPDININKSPKGIPKKAPGKASMGSRILGGLGKAAKVLGPVGAAVGAAYSGFQGYQNTAANFDLQEGQEATLGQKAASTLGGVASGLTFGLVDEKVASQKIHQAGEYVGEKAKAAYEGAKDIGGKAVSYVKEIAPVIGEKAKAAYTSAKEMGSQAVTFAGEKAKQVFSGAKEAVSSAGSKIADFFGVGKAKDTTVIEAAKQAVKSPIPVSTPTPTTSTGIQVAKTSTENMDLARASETATSAPRTIMSNNVNTVNKTSYVPINPTARLSSNSALDQYLLRTSVY